MTLQFKNRDLNSKSPWIQFELCLKPQTNANQPDPRIPVSQPALKVLQVLDLGENLLGNEGIQVIREPLMVNCSVLQLSLAQANISCEGTTT